MAETNIKAKDGLGLRFGHLGKLIVSTFYKKSYYFSMLHDMDKVLIKKVAETKINAVNYNELNIKSKRESKTNKKKTNQSVNRVRHVSRCYLLLIMSKGIN